MSTTLGFPRHTVPSLSCPPAALFACRVCVYGGGGGGGVFCGANTHGETAPCCRPRTLRPLQRTATVFLLLLLLLLLLRLGVAHRSRNDTLPQNTSSLETCKEPVETHQPPKAPGGLQLTRVRPGEHADSDADRGVHCKLAGAGHVLKNKVFSSYTNWPRRALPKIPSRYWHFGRPV